MFWSAGSLDQVDPYFIYFFFWGGSVSERDGVIGGQGWCGGSGSGPGSSGGATPSLDCLAQAPAHTWWLLAGAWATWLSGLYWGVVCSWVSGSMGGFAHCSPLGFLHCVC
ncbi:hypothetical protein ATANTOWER_026958 [Ataeniobius toweri]|uniref:Uncharacterized protein n=1 Tax=Ataeniobius toweri TaxID=208326 RepID=A0ABU7BL89_9TELE|nr:hypothetical protein [Ataeniobius toweri]